MINFLYLIIRVGTHFEFELRDLTNRLKDIASILSNERESEYRFFSFTLSAFIKIFI